MTLKRSGGLAPGRYTNAAGEERVIEELHDTPERLLTYRSRPVPGAILVDGRATIRETGFRAWLRRTSDRA